MDPAGLASMLGGRLGPFLSTFIVSLLPGVEPRYGLVVGVVLFNLPLWKALLASTIAALLLSVAVPAAVETAFNALARAARRLEAAGRIHGLLSRLAERSARRAQASIEKYSLAGLVIFVAIPLPLTGIYTGALAAYILGLRGPGVYLALAAGGIASILITGALTGIIL